MRWNHGERRKAFEAELGNRAVLYEAWNPRCRGDMIPLWIQSHFVFSMIEGGQYQSHHCIYRVGGIPTPLKNMSQIGSSSQLLGKKMFQTTNQYTMVFTVIVLASTWNHLDPRSLGTSPPSPHPHPLGLPGPQDVSQPFIGQIVDTSTLVSNQLLQVSGNGNHGNLDNDQLEHADVVLIPSS